MESTLADQALEKRPGGIGSWPVRKPLALGCAIWSLGTASVYVARGVDIPPGVLSFLGTVFSVVTVGYLGTSSFEHWTNKKTGG